MTKSGSGAPGTPGWPVRQDRQCGGGMVGSLLGMLVACRDPSEASAWGDSRDCVEEDTGDSSSPNLKKIHREPAVGLLGEGGHPAAGAELADGFGPRVVDGEEDFHPGLDWQGERGSAIRALSAGVVERVSEASGTESNHVVVRHSLASAVHFHGQEVRSWYSLYSHLERILVQEGQPLEAGERLGTMGDSGGATSVHLHVEVRLGTWCSLEYQLETPTSSCVTGYDPAINPFHALPGAEPGGLRLSRRSARSFLLSTPSPDLEFERIAADFGGVERVLDLDLREGLDAGSEATLDQLDLGWIRIEPLEFYAGDAESSWVLHFSNPPDRVEVSDIFGEGWRWEG